MAAKDTDDRKPDEQEAEILAGHEPGSGQEDDRRSPRERVHHL